MNILIKNITAILKDGARYKTQTCDIYIMDNIIAGINRVPSGFFTERVINGKGKLIAPGFVNAHTHAYMSVFRNSADDLAFDDWLFNHILPREDNLTGKDAYWGTLLSIIEMIKTGTTSFLDMHLFPHFVAKAVRDSGMRAVLSRAVVSNDPSDPNGERRLKEHMSDMQEFANIDTIGFMFSPHAPYSCDLKCIERCVELANEYDTGIQIHLSEGKNEVEGIRKQYNCTPVELMEKVGLLSNRLVAAHCVQLTNHDIELLKKYEVNVATNPISNLKLANGIAPVPHMLRAGINVCLGTDSDASNNNQNMVNEINFLTLIHKGFNKDPRLVSAHEGFKIATENGAKALGINAGVIEEGRLADLAIYNIDVPWFYPRADFVSAFAYSATGMECETLIVNGKILMEAGELTTIDEKKVYAEVSQK